MTAKIIDLTTGEEVPFDDSERTLNNLHANALITSESYASIAEKLRADTQWTGNLAVDTAAYRFITACEAAAMLFDSAAVAIQELREAS